MTEPCHTGPAAHVCGACADPEQTDDALLTTLRQHFETHGAVERAWGVHYAQMVLRGLLPVSHVPTG